MNRIEVIVETGDRLQREVWAFWYSDRDHELRCSSWRDESRVSLRHKYRADQVYEQNRRGTVERPTVPESVALAAKQQFIDALKVQA